MTRRITEQFRAFLEGLGAVLEIRFIARLRLVRARPVDWRHVGDRHGRWDALYGI